MGRNAEMIQLKLVLKKISDAASRGTGTTTFWFQVTPANIEAAVFYGQYFGFYVDTEYDDGGYYQVLFTFHSDERMIK